MTTTPRLLAFLPSAARLRRLSLLLSAVAAAGCGSGRFPTAPVTGTVLCDGFPVSGGVVSFAPIAEGDATSVGKPASGTVGPDGSFTLTTYEPDDGAVVGRHSVSYSPGGSGEQAPDPKAAKTRCENCAPVEVEVASGPNSVEVKFSSKDKAGPQAPGPG